MANNEQNGTEDKEDLSILLDSTYPLLQKFREAAPGTYKHSQALMSMMESISMALDLDTNFMKVASLYHDVGKMYNPKFFTENQLAEEGNPHDNIDPRMSYQIISRHVSDTVNILINDCKFPRKLIEVVSQHHGTNVVKYFFEKSGTDVEDVYRYKCTKPTCVEAAALMICDHVEAISRSKYQAGKLNPIEVIEYTISMLLDDGQLDEVVMKLGDLKRIKEALGKELEGVYQKRVDYDEAKNEKKSKKKKSAGEEKNE